MEVAVAEHPVVLTTGRLRALLAVLAMAAGRTVSVDRLADALWGEELPGNARRSVQTYVTRLRAALGADLISTSPGGYVLHAEPEDIDALRFLRILASTHPSLPPAEQRARLVEATALWRGTPFADVQSDVLAVTEAPRLLERYLAALEQRIDLDLAAGRFGELAAELSELTARHPLRESLWARLLVVLDRCGRPAEALASYETIRVRIAEELGVDPGAELKQIHADLLAGRSPVLAGFQPATTAPAGDGPPRPVPHQPPGDLDSFTGRAGPLEELDARLAAARNGPFVAVVHGTAGVGKAALAVHWAHLARDRFPDGQLYVDLRGYGPSCQALEPGDALRMFLTALGVAQSQIPVGTAAQAGLFRSTLAGKRVLIVLDNARDADQVRPLLPGEPGCAVVVTSRSQLTGLVAVDGAHPIAVELLTADEAQELLARRLGADRVAADAKAVEEIIARCARLPLALAIVAARAATNPGFPLADLAAQLRAALYSLDVFSAGDPAADVRSVLSWSYTTLGSMAARLFRLLSLHPAPDTATPAAASLAGVDVRQVKALLDELARAHLVSEHSPGRYQMHDLLRAYAAELSAAHDPDGDRAAARRRVLDHFLHTSVAAARLLAPHDEVITPPAAQPGVTPESLTDHRQAIGWFGAEYQSLLALLEHASASGLDADTWYLASTMWVFLERRGRWHELIGTETLVLQVVRQHADRPRQAAVHRALGMVRARLGCYDDARDEFETALELARKVGDIRAEAAIHLDFASLHGELRGNYHEALVHSRRALGLCESIGDAAGTAKMLNAVGWGCAQLGDQRQALALCTRALAIQERLGDRNGQAATRDSLGYVHHQMGDHERAIGAYRAAVALRRDTGHRYGQAAALLSLAEVYDTVGDDEAARDMRQEALAVFVELGHPDAERVRAKLRGLDPRQLAGRR